MMIRSLEKESEILGKASILLKSWQEGNARAISFYEKVGLRFDGVKKIVNLGSIISVVGKTTMEIMEPF